MFKQTAIIIGFVSCTTGSFAQMNESWKEMVIKVATLDEWGVYKINRQLQCLEGLHFSGYYKPASCLLLKYDPRKILDPAIAIGEELTHGIKRGFVVSLRFRVLFNAEGAGRFRDSALADIIETLRRIDRMHDGVGDAFHDSERARWKIADRLSRNVCP